MTCNGKVVPGAKAMLVMLLTASLLTYGWAAEIGLASRWNFQEGGGTTAYDSSGSGNNGSLVGDANFVSDPIMIGAVNFFGASGAVVVPHSASLQPATGTLAVSIKTNSVQDADIVMKATNRMVRTNVSGTFMVYGLRTLSNGAVEAVIANDDPVLGQWTRLRTRTSLVRKNTWTHLALRFDGKTLSVFVNGKLEAMAGYVPVPVTGLSYSGSFPVCFGCATVWAGRGSREFVGQMSQARLFGRGLTDAEILGEYNRAKAPSTN